MGGCRLVNFFTPSQAWREERGVHAASVAKAKSPVELPGVIVLSDDEAA